eukprot:scpid110638/ scgid33968/ 
MLAATPLGSLTAGLHHPRSDGSCMLCSSALASSYTVSSERLRSTVNISKPHTGDVTSPVRDGLLAALGPVEEGGIEAVPLDDSVGGGGDGDDSADDALVPGEEGGIEAVPLGDSGGMHHQRCHP